MKKLRLAVCAFMLSLLCTSVHAYTLTFDSIPDGDYLGHYATDYGALFGGFAIADRLNSLWGPPHSGNNVLTSFVLSSGGMLKFRVPDNPDEPYSVYSLGAYFSTELGTVIRIDGCHDTHAQVIASALIGSSTGSWNNTYVKIDDPLGRIKYFMFYPVSSSEALQHWSADDMTIVPVPEPSSLAVLGVGFLPLVVTTRRRHRCKRTKNIATL